VPSCATMKATKIQMCAAPAAARPGRHPPSGRSRRAAALGAGGRIVPAHVLAAKVAGGRGRRRSRRNSESPATMISVASAGAMAAASIVEVGAARLSKDQERRRKAGPSVRTGLSASSALARRHPLPQDLSMTSRYSESSRQPCISTLRRSERGHPLIPKFPFLARLVHVLLQARFVEPFDETARRRAQLARPARAARPGATLILAGMLPAMALSSSRCSWVPCENAARGPPGGHRARRRSPVRHRIRLDAFPPARVPPAEVPRQHRPLLLVRIWFSGEAVRRRLQRRRRRIRRAGSRDEHPLRSTTSKARRGTAPLHANGIVLCREAGAERKRWAARIRHAAILTRGAGPHSESAALRRT